MPTVTDWLMVGITAVYVIATIFICWANISSANATKKQIAQSENQFEETQRLGMMPYLTFEHIKDETLDSDIEILLPFTKEMSVSCHHSSIFRLKNIGNGTATTVIYTWRCGEKDICESECFPLNAISINSPYVITFFFADKEDGNNAFVYPSAATLTLQYYDLLGRIYEQKIIFKFKEKDYDDMVDECIVEVPEYQGAFSY